MKLDEFLPAEHIVINLNGQSKLEIIEELLIQMKTLDILTDFETALSDVLSREGYLSTGLENGLAIPHAKTKGIDKLAMVFGLAKEGVDFQSLDAKPTIFLFLVLSPLDTSGPHIQALAMITRNLKEKDVREKIKNAQSAAEIASIFKSFN